VAIPGLKLDKDHSIENARRLYISCKEAPDAVLIKACPDEKLELYF
jgi:hypothetical protein